MKIFKINRILKVVILILSNFSLSFSQSNNFSKNTVYKNSNLTLHSDLCFIDSSKSEGTWNYNGIISSDSNSKDYFSSTSKENPYGITYKTKFPKSVRFKNVKIVVQAHVRCSNIDNKASFGVSITKADSSIAWQEIQINTKINNPNEWTFITDTIILPRSIINNDNTITVFLWNIDGNGTADVDDINIQYLELITPSYLPNLTQSSHEIDYSKTLFKNDSYAVLIDSVSGIIGIGNKSGDVLINQLTYYIDYKKNKKETGATNFIVSNFKLTSMINGVFQFTGSNKDITINLTLNTSNNSLLEIKTKTTYKTNLFVFRESLVGDYKKELVEVYTSNRKLETENFESEYWLNKEGFKIGSKENSFLFYHPEHISSLQLNTAHKQFIINLDFNYDHLRLRFPLQKNDTVTGKKIDVSETFHQSKSSSFSDFIMQFGIDPIAAPRFMKNPNGFLSAYIFTEHADFSDLKTQRAVNYGSEDITKFNDAIGGFAKHKIPVTKSVFYHNPEKINNSNFNGAFNTEICNIKSTPNYLEMLKELHANNFEICLHTPEENTSNKAYLKEALSYFKTNFNSKNWIDHGYDNLKMNNREDFVCDGFEKNEAMYSQKLFKEFGVNYFWNCYNEDSSVFSNFNFNSNIKHPFIGFGNFMPIPNYSKHFINNDTVISWQASSTLLPSDGNSWEYYFNEQRLQTLINDYEVEINHCYPSRVDSLTGFYDVTENNKYVINSGFDNFLNNLSLQREKGNINTTTIKDFIDYNIAVENVSCEFINDNSVKLLNRNKFDIKGFSMIINSNLIKRNNGNFSQKKDGVSTIIWFNLMANEETIISFN
jgi:hypothetical protein